MRHQLTKNTSEAEGSESEDATTLDPEHLIVQGLGGAFLHPTHIFSGAKLPAKMFPNEKEIGEYVCQKAYPSPGKSLELTKYNLFRFRSMVNACFPFPLTSLFPEYEIRFSRRFVVFPISRLRHTSLSRYYYDIGSAILLQRSFCFLSLLPANDYRYLQSKLHLFGSIDCSLRRNVSLCCQRKCRMRISSTFRCHPCQR